MTARIRNLQDFSKQINLLRLSHFVALVIAAVVFVSLVFVVVVVAAVAATAVLSRRLQFACHYFCSPLFAKAMNQRLSRW